MLVVVVAVVGVGCGSSPLKHKASDSSGPIFADLPSTSAPGGYEEDREKFRPKNIIVTTFIEPRQPDVPFVATIREDGTVTLLSNKVFIAAGKTVREFDKELHNYYGWRSPAFGISDDHWVRIAGEVQSPGMRPWISGITALKAIQSSGGFTDRANPRKVHLKRSDGRELVVDCIKTQKHPELDLLVFPGDEIVVPRPGGNSKTAPVGPSLTF